MADPLTRFGLSRRPASEMFGEAPRPRRDSPTDLFGAADMRGPGWSDSARRAAEEHQFALDEELAIEDERIAAERQREAERVADKFTTIRNPSAREKFFDENEAAMTGSRRYNQLAEIRQRQPSFADNVLANNLANKIDDPDERNVFLGAVAKGAGTLAAREEADRFRIRRQQAARLGGAGYSPDEADEILAKGVDEARVNYAIAQRKDSSVGGSIDPKVKALTQHVGLLRDRLKYEADLNYGDPNPETVEKLRLLEAALEREYEKSHTPRAAAPASSPQPVVPIAGAGTLEQRGAQFRKKNNIE